jgi:hypothetical protein
VKFFWLADAPIEVGGCVYLLLLSIQGSGHVGVEAPWQCSDDGEADDGEAAQLLVTTQWAMFFLALGAWTRKRLLPPLSSGVSESSESVSSLGRRRIPEVISNVSPAEGAVRCTACVVVFVAVYFYVELFALVFGEVGDVCADANGPASGACSLLVLSVWRTISVSPARCELCRSNCVADHGGSVVVPAEYRHPWFDLLLLLLCWVAAAARMRDGN